MKQTFTLLTTLLLSIAAEAQTEPAKAPVSGAAGGKTIVTLSKSTPELPRKSEGDVVELTDGLLLPDWRMQDVIDLRVADIDTAWFYGESVGVAAPQDIEWSIAEALPNSRRPPDGMMYPSKINLAGPRTIGAGEPLRCWLRAVPPAVPLSYDGVGRRVEFRPELRVELLDAAGTVVAVERPAFPQATETIPERHASLVRKSGKDIFEGRGRMSATGQLCSCCCGRCAVGVWAGSRSGPRRLVLQMPDASYEGLGAPTTNMSRWLSLRSSASRAVRPDPATLGSPASVANARR